MNTIRIAPGWTSTSDVGREGCWFCNDDVRTASPPGGWMLDDGVWRAGAAPAPMAAAGTVILQTRRHVLDQAGFRAQESATLVPVLGRLMTAMRAALGCERVYQWSTMAAFAHFHVWLIPWWPTSAHEGPKHLVDVVEHGVTEAEAGAAASQIGEALRVLR